MPEIVEAGRVARAIGAAEAGALAQRPEGALRPGPGERVASAQGEERRDLARRPRDAPLGLGIRRQRARQPGTDRHQAGLVELALADGQPAPGPVHAGAGQGERLAQAEPGPVQDEQQPPEGRGGSGRWGSARRSVAASSRHTSWGV